MTNVKEKTASDTKAYYKKELDVFITYEEKIARLNLQIDDMTIALEMLHELKEDYINEELKKADKEFNELVENLEEVKEDV